MKRKKHAETRNYLLTAVLALISVGAQAQEVEVGIECDEGVEPVAISYAQHTTSCAIEQPTDIDRFTFCGEQDDAIELRFSSLSNFMDPKVTLRDPMAAVIAEQMCNDSCADLIELTLPITGCYTIFVADSSGLTPGSYQLQLERVLPADDAAQAINYDQTYSDEVSPTLDVDQFRFYGVDQSQVRLSVTAPANFMDPTIELRSPDGSLLIDGVADGATCNDSCTFSIDQTLTATGWYSLRIFDRLMVAQGNYSLNILCLLGECDSDGNGEPDDNSELLSYVTIQEDDIETTIDGDFFWFNGTVGTSLRLTVAALSNFMDPTIEIRDPSNELIADGFIDGASCNDSCSFTLDIEPQINGRYSLLIYDRFGVATGSYEMALWCLYGPCDSDADGIEDGTVRVSEDTSVVLAYGAPANDSIEFPTDSDIFIFGGVAGDLVQLNVAAPANFMDPTIEIRDPSGMVIIDGVLDGATCTDSCAFNLELNPAVTGVYSLLIYDRNNVATGNYELGLQCLIGTCSNVTASCGDNCIDEPNGPLIPDFGGNSQYDSDGDGYGNACDFDLDENFIINFLDLSIWSEGFLGTDPELDFNGDGVANFLDLAMFTRRFLMPPGPSC